MYCPSGRNALQCVSLLALIMDLSCAKEAVGSCYRIRVIHCKLFLLPLAVKFQCHAALMEDISTLFQKFTKKQAYLRLDWLGVLSWKRAVNKEYLEEKLLGSSLFQHKKENTVLNWV